MIIGLDVHKGSVYATVIEDNGNIIVQRNMENNMELINKFFLDYKDRDMVIESSTSRKIVYNQINGTLLQI